ncbi:hypothetical protein PVAP13_2KG126972 [Panicum virgatum]|uniref:Homologous recombination OB-fold protein OB-fold domain-containing protein n=1 Tax=Panicum virgatum TaxID=38727 RepID=A0A8T0W8F0_PANVG|nr:hypothetical protein PVAP13_2KG126972 [Panicum virgatum]
MAHLLLSPAAADAAWEAALDVDDSDIRPDAPFLSPPTPHSRATAPSRGDRPAHPSRRRGAPEPASAVQDAARRRGADGGSPLALGRAGPVKDRAWEQPEIEEIRRDEELRRAPLVAGVVTSCKPNGLGDLLITLKDPTDTISAAVHKKVLLEGNYGQDISIGCVILLSKVPVFRPTPKACYLNITKVVKIFRKDCDAPSKRLISSNTTERSEDSTTNIMTRLLGHERMMATLDIYARCSIGNNQEGGLQMLAGGPRRKTCSQPSLCGSTVMFGDRYSTQASDNENIRLPFDNEKMLHISKKLKSDAMLPDGNVETASSRIDTENNQVLKRNMNTELDGMSEQFNGQHASIKEPIEHQQRNFTAVNAGCVQPTQEYAPSISGSLINPKKAMPVASLAEWTDDQISELFADY